MRISVVTLFPEFFDSPLGVSIPARAIDGGAATVDFVNPREFATDKHRTVDDTPYGGGAGMVMRAPELEAAVRSVNADGERRNVLLTPQGAPFSQRTAKRLADSDGFVLICGRYEGMDERFIEAYVDEELSLGDFILSGGEPAALTVIDAVLRLLPEVLGNDASLDVESFSEPLLEAPHFTRPATFDGQGVPDVLLSGHHARIDDWRRKVSLLRTLERRPDLLDRNELSADDRALLDDESLEVPRWLVQARFPQSRG